jgi:hypothetical protein
MTSRCVVVMGILGRTPVAGVAWQVLHYLEGLRRLGHDVFYVEDTQESPYNPDTGGSDCEFTVRYIDRLTAWCGLEGRWAFVDGSPQGRVYGLSSSRLSGVFERADALINLTGSTMLREEHLRVPIRAYLETDPGVPQIEVAKGLTSTIDFLGAHTHHFTFGENVGTSACPLPVAPFAYRHTRQPVVLEWWGPCGREPAAARGENGRPFRTVATWQQSNDIEWNGERYTWSKDEQFRKFIDLPRRRAGEAFELALACDDASALALLTSNGWDVVDALPLTSDLAPYREYIVGARGEFTVAKDQNIRLRTGWFSDRSACFLAAGRPVITQDTAFDRVLPCGRGLFAFGAMEDVLAALDAVRSNYSAHSRFAMDIATEYFGAEKVVRDLLEQMGV